jgi:hypothetical protein
MTDKLVPLSVLALDAGISADELERRYAEDVLIDYLGRPSIEVDIACQLIAEHRARRAAAAAAERERRERERAEREQQAARHDAWLAGLQARAGRQRKLLRDNRDLSASMIMQLDSGDPDRKLDRAGRIRDQYAEAEREGNIGFGRFGRVPSGG